MTAAPPRYAEADVERLVQVARTLHTRCAMRAWVNPESRLTDTLAKALEPFQLQPPAPTPEQEREARGRVARGRVALETHVANLPARSGAWRVLEDEDHEHWCRVADAVLAKQAEQEVRHDDIR